MVDLVPPAVYKGLQAGLQAQALSIKGQAGTNSALDWTQQLLGCLLVRDGSSNVALSEFSFPTADPTDHPTDHPTEVPTDAPSLPMTDTGFGLAGGFAFLMSFSLFIFCYMQASQAQTLGRQ